MDGMFSEEELSDLLQISEDLRKERVLGKSSNTDKKENIEVLDPGDDYNRYSNEKKQIDLIKEILEEQFGEVSEDFIKVLLSKISGKNLEQDESVSSEVIHGEVIDTEKVETLSDDVIYLKNKLEKYYKKEIPNDIIQGFSDSLDEKDVTFVFTKDIIKCFEEYINVEKLFKEEKKSEEDSVEEKLNINDFVHIQLFLQQYYDKIITIEEINDFVIYLHSQHVTESINLETIIVYFEKFKNRKEKETRKVKEVKIPKKKFSLKNKIESCFNKVFEKLLDEDFEFGFEDEQDDEFEFEFVDNQIDDSNWVIETIQKFFNYNNIVLSEEAFQVFLDGISSAISNGEIGATKEELINYLLSIDSSYVYGDSPGFDNSGRSM